MTAQAALDLFPLPSIDLREGDCLDVLATVPDGSVAAVVTDPPYGLDFMGRAWDGAVPGVTYWRECLRVLAPGGHLLAFGGTRTAHRLAVAVEDAGFEIRDTITWLYGSGFPKSRDVGKAIDKLDAAAERLARAREFQAWLRQHLTPQQVNAATGTDMGHHLTTHPTQPAVATADLFDLLRPLLPEVPERIEQLVAQRTVESRNYAAREVLDVEHRFNEPSGVVNIGQGERTAIERKITAAHTDAARQWQGWGTALKPASEPIIVARKPLTGTVADNVQAHGTGALNVDACRVAPHASDKPGKPYVGPTGRRGGIMGEVVERHRASDQADPAGRWPANVVLAHAPDCADQCTEGCPVAELDAQSGILTTNPGTYRRKAEDVKAERSAYRIDPREGSVTSTGDSGGASRFFPTFRYQAKAPTSERPKIDGRGWPTVKPVALMRWLVRLVTPPGGLVLDPFTGTGPTLLAAQLEGFPSLGIEADRFAYRLAHVRFGWADPGP